HYQRAVELDPNFAMAYARLGAVYNNLGQTEVSERNRQKAFELRDRASEREKFYITTHYFADSGQLDKAITTLEMYRQTYQNEPIRYTNLANTYKPREQFENALPNGRRGVEIAPESRSAYETLALAYVVQNRLDEARATINAGLQVKPGGSMTLMLASL